MGNTDDHNFNTSYKMGKKKHAWQAVIGLKEGEGKRFKEGDRIKEETIFAQRPIFLKGGASHVRHG